MPDRREITVYSFRLYDRHAEIPHVAGFKAPRDVIRALGGDPIPGTEEAVPATALDDRGHYRRRATGWGDLN